EWIKKYACTYWVFVLLNGVYFGLVLLIPGSIANFLIELENPSSYLQFLLQRIIDVKGMMPLNWPIFLFGMLGIFFFLENFVLLSILLILTLLIPLLVKGHFYIHHVTVIAVPFAIMGGIFLHKILLMFS